MTKQQLTYDLFEAYYSARKNKRKTINALAFEVNYESKLIQLAEDIWERKYKIGRSICFINFKPVQREIFAGDFRDRIVHHLIFSYLNPIVEPSFIKDSYSCRVGKGTHYGINRVAGFIRNGSQNYTKDVWVLKMDILGYFMNIDRYLLFDKIQHKLNHYTLPIKFEQSLLVYLLEKIIFNDPTQNCIIKGKAADWKGLPKSKSLFHTPTGKGFPIGNLSSQLFSNIYLNELDHFVKEELKLKYYGRYVDDFVLVHSDKDYLKSCIPIIHDFLRDKLSLELHPRKIYFQHYSKGVAFLGTYILPHRIYVGKRVKNNFHQTIIRWNTSMKESNGKLSKPILSNFISVINSFLGLFKHYQSYRLRKKMINSLSPYFFNYVYVSGGYSKLVPKIRRLKAPPKNRF